jgi:hypothetical protein
MPHLRHRAKKDDEKRPPPGEETAPESKLAGLKPMEHRDADDEQPTREDRQTGGRPSSPPGVPGF